MQNDKTTLKDLSFFPADGVEGIFSLIDRTTTQAGREALRRHVFQTPATYQHLSRLQEVVRFFAQNPAKWPAWVSNGTIVMLEKFYESADDAAMPPTGVTLLLGRFFQKMLNRRQYFLTRFSLSHVSDFLRGCMFLAEMRLEPGTPGLLVAELEAMAEELKQRLVPLLVAVDDDTGYEELARLDYQARRETKAMVHRLMLAYARLDAWRAMALAGNEHGWVFPVITETDVATTAVKGLFHPLLHRAVSYDVHFNTGQHLMMLTGANMSGKTTFMRALGVAAVLAHLGMAVPAEQMQLSFLHGIITNMHVEDNIIKGESYFLAEVLRMKQTATQLLRQEPQLVLMDELFKGTNVHDAFECTRAVTEGLLTCARHLMVLSTHLYEVAHVFAEKNNILFTHFVTHLKDDGSFDFTYRLEQGISDDRIGYRILQREGVIALLHEKGG